jgi:hypothetical protein
VRKTFANILMFFIWKKQAAVTTRINTISAARDGYIMKRRLLDPKQM